MAAIGHGHGDGERLAAGAGAEIADAHLRLGAERECDELAALVLDLDQAGAERLAGGDHAAAGRTQAPGREGRRGDLDVLARQGRHRVLAGAVEQVDAQIERGGFAEGCEFGFKLCPEPGLQARQQPVRDFEADGVGHVRMVDRVAVDGFEGACLVGVEGAGCVSAAGEERAHGFQSGAREEEVSRDAQPGAGRRRLGAFEPPVETAGAAEHVPDQGRDLAPVG